MSINSSPTLLQRWSRPLAIAALFLAGLSSVHAQTPKRGGTLTVIAQPEPVILTAALSTSSPTGIFSTNVFDGLIEYDNAFHLKPGLAVKWAFSPDGKTLTLNLRQGVKWHDGKPFTSADVKWTLENVWKKYHPRNQALFANAESVDTPDDYTVIVHFSKPSLAVLSSLNSNGAQVLPKHLYEGTDILNNPYNNKPVGTGPFIFRKWVKGDYILLERNPDYWDKGKPYLDKVIYRVIPDGGARTAALEKGEVQYAPLSPVPARDAQRLAKLPTLKVDTKGYEWLSPWLFLDINNERPQLKDARVRQALYLAIDRNAYNRVVWSGFGKPAVSPVVSTLTEFFEPNVPQYPYDVAKANALLDQAGYKAGANGTRFKLTIDYLPYGDEFLRSAEFIKQAFKRIGIDADIRNQDTPTYTRRIYGDRDYDVTIQWYAGFSDPQVGVTREYQSDSIGKNIPFTNGSGYRNAQVDQWIREAQASGDQAERVKLFKQFQRQVQTDLPSLPLLELHFFTVHSADLNDTVSGVDQVYGSFKNVWYTDPSKHP
ncbi:ABC transporter substrate-binding protein [Caballeronia grimmiae]|uniref:ABC transporter substrate-binding protein n=1 Tax=Caballeronia grimmiae TaxID=1071679 RepID=A0A069PCV8_9BURK|nr:ABC transporter substrate-binding protein [Caballeronia grimmiae]KDR35116.1 ABC transporter substrate-binding protein [Caballeronia grimmiae]GGD89212.1 peptide ABC transporter substrate-binding protein [Caballeronia grimmiae]